MMNVLSVSVLYLSLVLSSKRKNDDNDLASSSSKSPRVGGDLATNIETQDIIKENCTRVNPTDLDNAEAIHSEKVTNGSKPAESHQEELALFQIANEFVLSEETSKESGDKPKQNQNQIADEIVSSEASTKGSTDKPKHETTYKKLHEDISRILYDELLRKCQYPAPFNKVSFTPDQVREIFDQASKTFFQLTGLVFPYELYENALIYFKDLLLNCDLPNSQAESILRNFLISLTLRVIRKEEYRDISHYNEEYLNAIQEVQIKIIEELKGDITEFDLVNGIAVSTPEKEPDLEDAKEIIKKIMKEIINNTSCFTPNNQNEYDGKKTIYVLKLVCSLVELSENALQLFKTSLTPILEIYDFIHLQENFQKKKEDFEKSPPNPQAIIEFQEDIRIFLNKLNFYIRFLEDPPGFFMNFFKYICPVNVDQPDKTEIGSRELTDCLEKIKKRYDLFRKAKDQIVTAPMKERLLRLLHLLIFQFKVFGKLFSDNYDWEKDLLEHLTNSEKQKIYRRTNFTLLDFYHIKEPLIKEELLNPEITSIQFDDRVLAAVASADTASNADEEFLEIKNKYLEKIEFPYIGDIKDKNKVESKYPLRLVYSLITEYEFVLPLIQLRASLIKLHLSDRTAWSENAENSENLKNITIILYNRLCDSSVKDDPDNLYKIDFVRAAIMLNREFSNFLREKDKKDLFPTEKILNSNEIMSIVDKYLAARENSSFGQVKAPNRTQRSKKCTRRVRSESPQLCTRRGSGS